MQFVFKGKPLSYWLRRSSSQQPSDPPATASSAEFYSLPATAAVPTDDEPAFPIESSVPKCPDVVDGDEHAQSLLELDWCSPALTKTLREAKRAAREAERHAQSRLLSIVGAIAGIEGVLASTCGLFLVTERNTLRAEVLWNTDKPDDWELPLDSPGILPMVARDGGFVTTDSDDPDYLSANPDTQSELAVAVKHEGIVIGVLNLESIRPYCYSTQTLRLFENSLPDLVPHLLVLRSLDRDRHLGCPWHPEKHGWDLQDLMGRLCRAFVEGIGKATAICTVSYVDPDKEERFAYGTSGYDWPYHQCQRSLSSCGNKVEEFVRDAEENILPIRPADAANFLDHGKAEALGIASGLLKNIVRTTESVKETIGIVTVYFTRSQMPGEDDVRQKVAEVALPGFTNLLSRLITEYARQRPLLATAVFRAQQARLTDCSTTVRLEFALQKICELLQSPAASLYAYEAETDRLLCVATTGFRKEILPSAASLANERDPSQQEDIIPLGANRGHTIAAFRSHKALRRNRLSYRGEKGLTDHCPERGANSRPEFIAGENVADRQHSKRRFLGCRVLYHDAPIGVMRVVRPEQSCPFTKCDEALIHALAEQIAPLLNQRLDEFALPDAAREETEKRLTAKCQHL